MNHMNTLKSQLADYQTGFKQRAAPERVAMMEDATAQLRASGIEDTALPLGAPLPNVSLTDALGYTVGLKSLHAGKPTVIIFYRGGWCPYCNLELREWQRLLPDLQSAGAQLIAISPQLPDNSLNTSQKNELAYPVLSDSSLAAANAFGIAFELPPELIELYSKVGNDLPTLNGNGQWVLPIPATFVFDAAGNLVFRHVESDYRQRAEPTQVIELLSTL
jgi:peroxiredoxin